MPDLHPTSGKVSTLPTSPTSSSTPVYRKRPLTAGQIGYATSYTPTGEGFTYTLKPNYYQLAVWDDARRKEPIIKQGLEYIVQAVLSRMGGYSHNDSKIQDFICANIEPRMNVWIADMLLTALWSGFSVSEIVYQYKMGPKGIPQVWIENLVNFHPMQVFFNLNNYGMLKDGDIVFGSPFKSGIYVPTPSYLLSLPKKGRDYMGALVRLPKHKRMYMSLGGEGNNPYGKSTLESVLQYHFYKEAFRDMMMTALDRYGTPLLYAVVPPLNTKENVNEPDGTVRPKTLQEMTLETFENLSSESALVFTQASKDQPIEVKSLTTGNNFSSSFIEAIDLCDFNMMTGLGLPNLLMKDNGSKLGSGGASERQIELFDSFINSLFDMVVNPFVNQVVLQLIQYNFDPRTNEKAYDPGQINRRPGRISELKEVANLYDVLTRTGFVNPYNPLDFKHVRDMFGIPDRKIAPSDMIYILPERRQERLNVDAPTQQTPEELLGDDSGTNDQADILPGKASSRVTINEPGSKPAMPGGNQPTSNTPGTQPVPPTKANTKTNKGTRSNKKSKL